MKRKELNCAPGCPVEAALALIGGKWKGVVLYHLCEETLRFNEIKRRLPGVTQRMLTKQLRELEKDDLVMRKVYAEVPPKVEYSLTQFGATLKPVIEALAKWGRRHTGSQTKLVLVGPGSRGAAPQQ